MRPGSPLAALCPEPVARNGFSLACNRCRLSAASIPGSKFPACYFASFRIVSAPGPPPAPLPSTRFAPVMAVSLPGARCPSTIWSGRPRPLRPLPFRTLTSLGIKAFSNVCCLPVHLTNPPDSLSLPAARPRKLGLRIIVPGPLRFRRLAVPQTSRNLLHYAPDCARGQCFLCSLPHLFLSIYLPCFSMIYRICSPDFLWIKHAAGVLVCDTVSENAQTCHTPRRHR
jgi:hypothetical protein